MSFEQDILDFFSEEVKEIKEKGIEGFLNSEVLPYYYSYIDYFPAMWFVYHSIDFYIKNSSKSNSIFKEGVKVIVDLDPISHAPHVCLTRGNLSSRVTYFSVKDQKDHMLWFSFKNPYFTQWLKNKYGRIENLKAYYQEYISSLINLYSNQTMMTFSYKIGDSLESPSQKLHEQPKKEFLFHLLKSYDESHHRNDVSLLRKILSMMLFKNNNRTVEISRDVRNEGQNEFNMNMLLPLFNMRPFSFEDEAKEDEAKETFNHDLFFYGINKTLYNEVTISHYDKKDSFALNYKESFKRFVTLEGESAHFFKKNCPFVPLAVEGDIMDFIDPMKVDLKLQISLEDIEIDTRSVLRSYAFDAAHPFHEALKTKALNKIEIIVAKKQEQT